MARGITQDQVNQAADAILAAGENPTVEKVRTELGTGSPNTITRMLDTWRSQLGDRLRQLSALPDVPGPVGQAMIELWRLAAEHGERAMEDRLASDRALLSAARAELTLERESWEARLQAAELSAAQARTARDLAEHTCATLDGQLQDSHALRADLLQQRDRLQAQADLQAKQIEALRAELDDHRTALRAERDRLESHGRAVEDRAHQEIDRARQETKQWQQRYEAAAQNHRDVITDLQNRYESANHQARHHDQEVARQAGQITALEKALAEAYVVANAAKTSRATPKVIAKRSQGQQKRARPRPPK